MLEHCWNYGHRRKVGSWAVWHQQIKRKTMTSWHSKCKSWQCLASNGHKGNGLSHKCNIILGSFLTTDFRHFSVDVRQLTRLVRQLEHLIDSDWRTVARQLKNVWFKKYKYIQISGSTTKTKTVWFDNYVCLVCTRISTESTLNTPYTNPK